MITNSEICNLPDIFLTMIIQKYDNDQEIVGIQRKNADGQRICSFVTSLLSKIYFWNGNRWTFAWCIPEGKYSGESERVTLTKIMRVITACNYFYWWRRLRQDAKFGEGYEKLCRDTFSARKQKNLLDRFLNSSTNNSGLQVYVLAKTHIDVIGYKKRSVQVLVSCSV